MQSPALRLLATLSFLLIGAASFSQPALGCAVPPPREVDPNMAIEFLPIDPIFPNRIPFRVIIKNFSTFAPTDDPSTITCACGIATSPELTIIDAFVVDPNGNELISLVPDPNGGLSPQKFFEDFNINPTTSTSFNDLVPVAEKIWTGFSSEINEITSGLAAHLVFEGYANPLSPNQIKDRLSSIFVGTAQADLSGGNFAVGHQGVIHVPRLDTIPTLSEWGLIVLTAVLLLGGLYALRRQRTRNWGSTP